VLRCSSGSAHPPTMSAHAQMIDKGFICSF
jgi:hypothetical protein